ncbi:MAG: sigma-70 family RNA polymerase sigma factor [Pirellulaceae bacterium]|nr:sigma-70 family RNA polymerase sigma factor [Pirellulaceae bacterium]
MSVNSDVTSMSLLGRAVAEDEEAWHQLVHLYGPLVQRWCHSAGLSEEDTADVFQDVFQTVAKNLKKFEPRRSVASFRSWLKTICRTKTVDHFRKANRQATPTGGTDAQLRIAEVADPFDEESEEQAASEDAFIVQRAMDLIKDEFDPRNWKAFEQVALHERSPTDVATELDVAPQTIRQANYRIRRRLRLVLEDLVD